MGWVKVIDKILLVVHVSGKVTLYDTAGHGDISLQTSLSGLHGHMHIPAI